MLRVPQTLADTAPATAPDSPPADRLVVRRWRDPRLWVGLVLVAASVLVGSRLLAAADDTVGVWALTRDVPAGAPLTADVLAVRQVRFGDDATEAGYLPAARPPGPRAVARRDLAAGELLARAAVGRPARSAVELPVVVGPGGAPDDLQVGDVVDVWVGPPPGSGSTAPAARMLTAVSVVRAAHTSGPLGEAAERQVLLGLDAAERPALGPLLGRLAGGSVVLVRHGGGA